MLTRSSVIALCCLCACASTAQNTAKAPAPQDAPASQAAATTTAGQDQTAEAKLDSLLDELRALDMRTHPTWATYEGIRDYDDQVADLSQAASLRYIEQVEALASRVKAIPTAALSPMSQDTQRMVALHARGLRQQLACKSDLWNVHGLGGPHVGYPMLPVFHLVRGQKDVDTLAARYSKLGTQIDQIIANLRQGLSEGLTAPKPNVQRALTQVEALIKQPVDPTHPMLKLKLADPNTPLDTSALPTQLDTVVLPALGRYRDLLKTEILPAAREEVGIQSLPLGQACYRAQIEGFIGSGYTPDQLHQIGLEQLALSQQGMIDVVKELGSQAINLANGMENFLKDIAKKATSEEQLITLSTQSVERARQKVPEFFGIVPKTPVEVRPMEPHRAPDAPAAYYYSAPDDGSRPGIYYINTYKPQTRDLHNLQALAFHEAIPGHHLQIAIAKELPDVHRWRKDARQTAFTEGWGLYAELLADEMGLYSSPQDRFGMHNYQAWRAVRLVVDTGMHAKGWSRRQALNFMTENTALSLAEAENEIDRYIAWPGQALSYMVGRLKIQELRARAEATLGEEFVLPEFHDVVLGRGAVPLSILEEHVDAWIASKKAH